MFSIYHNYYQRLVHFSIKNQKGLNHKKAMSRFFIILGLKIKYLSVFFKKSIDLPYLEVFVTTHCNLRCAGCSNLISSCQNKGEHLDLNQIEDSLGEVLKNVHSIERIKIHGGEPFLYPELAQFTDFLGKQEKIHSIRLATNGTIIPSKEDLEAFAKAGVHIHFSNYSSQVAKNREKLSTVLSSYHIKNYQLVDQKWRDMGDVTLKNRSSKETERMVKKCTARQCTSLYKDKIFVCSRAAMMEKQGLIPPIQDSIPVYTTQRDFEKKMKAFFKKKSFEACRYCDGTAGLKEIEPGAQLPDNSK